MSIDTSNPAVAATIGDTVSADGLSTNYHAAGDGPPLVLIHGSGPGVSAWANWEHNIPVLSKDFSVYAYDVIGFGHSEFLSEYSWERVIDHLFGFLDALEIESPVLVGNSMGGFISMLAALRAPERVRGMVLMGSPGADVPMPKAVAAGRNRSQEMSPELMRKILQRFVCDRSIVTDDLVDARYEMAVAPGAGEAFLQLAKVGVRIPDEEMVKIETPTLVIHGREDAVIPLDLGLRLHHNIKDSNMLVLGNCGHWTQIEQLDQFNRSVRDFALGLN